MPVTTCGNWLVFTFAKAACPKDGACKAGGLPPKTSERMIKYCVPLISVPLISLARCWRVIPFPRPRVSRTGSALALRASCKFLLCSHSDGVS